MSALKNPYVTQLVGHVMDMPRLSASLIMELCEGCSVNDFLYPTLTLIVPEPAHDQAAAYVAHAQGVWKASVADYFNAVLHRRGYAFDKFIMFKLTNEVVLAGSKEGRCVLKQARVGSRLAPLLTGWKDVEPAPAETPVLVVSTGPLVYSFPLPSNDLSDLTIVTQVRQASRDTKIAFSLRRAMLQ